MPTTQVATHPFKVGDIVVNSWGYDQTNVDAYQVVAATPKSVKLARILMAGVPGTDGFMSRHVVPVKDQFATPRFASDDIAKVVTKFPRRVTWRGPDCDEWYVSFDHGSAAVHTEGESYYCSWYA